jgi:hypothetical protein
MSDSTGENETGRMIQVEEKGEERQVKGRSEDR